MTFWDAFMHESVHPWSHKGAVFIVSLLPVQWFIFDFPVLPQSWPDRIGLVRPPKVQSAWLRNFACLPANCIIHCIIVCGQARSHYSMSWKKFHWRELRHRRCLFPSNPSMLADECMNCWFKKPRSTCATAVETFRHEVVRSPAVNWTQLHSTACMNMQEIEWIGRWKKSSTNEIGHWHTNLCFVAGQAWTHETALAHKPKRCAIHGEAGLCLTDSCIKSGHMCWVKHLRASQRSILCRTHPTSKGILLLFSPVHNFCHPILPQSGRTSRPPPDFSRLTFSTSPLLFMLLCSTKWARFALHFFHIENIFEFHWLQFVVPKFPLLGKRIRYVNTAPFLFNASATKTIVYFGAASKRASLF